MPERDSNADGFPPVRGDYDRATKTPARIATAAVLGTACLALSAHAADAGLAPTVARFDHLPVGASASVANLRIASGHLVLALKSSRWKFGSTKTVVALLNFMTKKDFNPFFDENYWGTGMPRD